MVTGKTFSMKERPVNFENLKISSDLKKATQLLLICRATVSVLRPVIEQIQVDLLAKHQFKSCFADEPRLRLEGTDQIIRKHTDLYHLQDEDVKTFYSDLDAAYRANGFKPEKEGGCPLLEMEWYETEAENLVIDLSTYIAGVTRSQLSNVKRRNEYLEIVLKLVCGMTNVSFESSMALVNIERPDFFAGLNADIVALQTNTPGELTFIIHTISQKLKVKNCKSEAHAKMKTGLTEEEIITIELVRPE